MQQDLLVHMLINFFILVGFTMLLFWFLLNNVNYTKKQEKLIILILTSVGMILGIVASYQIHMDTYIDLRYVVLFITTLYAGYRKGVFLALLIVFIHIFFFQWSSFIVTFTSTLYFLVVGILFHKRFLNSNFAFKFILLFVVHLFYPTVVAAVSHHHEHAHDYSASLLLYTSYMFIAALFEVFFVSYLIRTILFKRQMMSLEKYQLVSEMASSISHEIRNPLTSASGFLQLLAQQNVTDEERIQYADFALEAVNQANQVITDYLALAKPHLENVTDINIAEETEKVVSLLYPYALERKVVIAFYFADEECIIRGTSQRFRQAIMNIMKNGIESMSEQGGTLFVIITKKSYACELQIRDEGHGIDEETLQNLGKPFYTTKTEGTGLGLTVVYNILETMGASIHVDSILNEGTTFTIEFPIS